MLFPASALPEGKEKTKLKFRQNGIPKSWDNQDLLIRALPSLQNIIFSLQFCCINLALLEAAGSQRSSACQWPQKPFWGQGQGVFHWPLAGGLLLLSWLLEISLSGF